MVSQRSQKGTNACNLILDDLEKTVNNELITFVGDKQLLRAVQPTANCEEM